MDVCPRFSPVRERHRDALPRGVSMKILLLKVSCVILISVSRRKITTIGQYFSLVFLTKSHFGFWETYIQCIQYILFPQQFCPILTLSPPGVQWVTDMAVWALAWYIFYLSATISVSPVGSLVSGWTGMVLCSVVSLVFVVTLWSSPEEVPVP